MINPELKVGDRVVLITMDDFNPVLYGTKGTIKKVVSFFNNIQYSVEWDDGRVLDIIPETDTYMKEEDFENKVKKRKINEMDHHMERLYSNIEIFRNFNMKFLDGYLKMVRKSGITNMYGASPYLYVGKDKIEDEMRYKDLEGEEYDEVLENADTARELMIAGTINYLEKKGLEIDVDSVKRYLPKLAQKVVENYMLLY